MAHSANMLSTLQQPIYKHERNKPQIHDPPHFIRQSYNLLGMALFYKMIWLGLCYLPVGNAILAFMFR